MSFLCQDPVINHGAFRILLNIWNDGPYTYPFFFKNLLIICPGDLFSFPSSCKVHMDILVGSLSALTYSGIFSAPNFSAGDLHFPQASALCRVPPQKSFLARLSPALPARLPEVQPKCQSFPSNHSIPILH